MRDYQARSDLLIDRNILVTGAGDGIGRAAAKAFAAHGATVILVGRTTSKLEKVYDEIIDMDAPQAAIYPLNLETASTQDFAELAAVIEQEFSHLDGLLHNASILGQRTMIQQYPLETWQKVLQVNLTAPFLMTQALLSPLNKSRDASIILTSSRVGRQSRAYWGAYAVSKFAVEGLMQTLADELEATSQVRVNSINPGPTRTKMRAQAYPAESPNNNPKPADIMATYLYLIGPDSRGTTGKQFDAQ